MTVFILIILGTINGQPHAAPAGVFQTEADCQRQWQLLGAAAMLSPKHADGLAGACVSYEMPGRGV